MATPERFEIRQVSRITKLSEAMINYLCRSGLLIPSVRKGKRGRGKPRIFSYPDLLYIISVKSLLDRGVSVTRISKCLKQLKIQCDESCTLKELSEVRLLVTDGNAVFRLSKENTLENLTNNGQFEFLFILDHLNLKSELDKIILAEAA